MRHVDWMLADVNFSELIEMPAVAQAAGCKTQFDRLPVGLGDKPTRRIDAVIEYHGSDRQRLEAGGHGERADGSASGGVVDGQLRRRIPAQ